MTEYSDIDLLNKLRNGNEEAFELLVRIPGWAKNSAIPGNIYKFMNG